MSKSKRSGRISKVKSQIEASPQYKKMLVFLLISLTCLLIAHFNFNHFYCLFIVGLIGFSFTTTFLIVTILERFLPARLVGHRLWTGEGIGGKSLAGLIAGILAIVIMVGIPFLMKKVGVDYIK